MDSQVSAGSILSGLYFCLSLGNILGPCLASSFLAEDDPTNVSRIIARSLPALQHLTDFQILSLAIGLCFLLGASLCTLSEGMFRKWDETAADEKYDNCHASSRGKGLKSCPLSYSVFIVSVLGFLATANGINFGFSNFLTAYSMKSALAESKSFGANVTAMYFLSQTIARFVMTMVSVWLRPVWIIAIDMFILASGSVILLASDQDDVYHFQVGVVLIGIGIGNLAPSGLAWTQEQVNPSSKLFAVMLVTLSVGAQIFKIPIAMLIEDFPQSHLYISCGSTFLIPPAFLIAKCLVDRHRK